LTVGITGPLSFPAGLIPRHIGLDCRDNLLGSATRFNHCIKNRCVDHPRTA